MTLFLATCLELCHERDRDCVDNTDDAHFEPLNESILFELLDGIPRYFQSAIPAVRVSSLCEDVCERLDTKVTV